MKIMLYKLRLISIIIFLLISISFVAFTELPNKIITTDLLAKEAGHNISYIISVFAFLTAMAITFPGKAASLSVLLTNTAYKAFEKRETIFIISVVFLLNFTLKFAMSFAVPQTFYYHDGAQYSSIALHIYNGDGFVSNALWTVMLHEKTDVLPFQQKISAPLVPYMIAVSYSLLGVSFFTEKILFVLISSVIPAAGYLLFRKISNKETAILGSILLSFDWIVFTYSRVVHTELPFMLFGILFLLALFNFRERKSDYFLISLFFALSYLTRYQALYTLPIIACAYMFMKTKSLKATAKHITVMAIIFLVLASPWLIRNIQVAGGPFTNDIGYLITAHYGGRDFSHYIYSLDTKPETFFKVLLGNPLLAAKEYVNTFTGLIMQTPLLVFSNPLLFFFALIGAINYRNYGKKEEMFAIFLYIIITYATMSFTLPIARYIYNLIPIYAFLSATGIYAMYRIYGTKIRDYIEVYVPILMLSVLFVLAMHLFLISFAYHNLENKGESSLGTSVLFKEFIEPNNLTNSTFMVDSFPYFYEYYSGTRMKVVQFPYYTNEKDFYSYAEKYGVEYVVLHKDSILRIPIKLPANFTGQKIFENDKRIVYTLEGIYDGKDGIT